jgi:asparagine synthase (glutamine-hydrolysing)
MSGIAAIIRLDGGPADPAALRAMTAAMAYRGPDGITHWHAASAALGHCMMHATGESLEASQPLASEDGAAHLVMDGWLANPEELRAELAGRGVRPRNRSDAELVFKAWQTWGEHCCEHIDGEYAFIVWDRRSRSLFAARDHLGLRPLHYHCDGKRLIVASDIAAVLAAGDFVARLNPGMVAEHLANEWYSRDETLWQGVMRLRPAHAISADSRGLQVVRHWSPPLGETLRYSRDEDYLEHYRHLLTDSVRRASRSHLPVGCGVSGGLDSSAIFGAGQHLLREGGFQAPGLHGFTYWLDPVAYPETDERAFVEAVEAFWNTPIQRIAPFIADSLDWYIERGKADRDMMAYPNAAMIHAIGEASRANGTRVVLNGEGGDQTLTGSRVFYAGQLASGDWAGLRTSLAADRRDSGLARTAWYLARIGIGLNLPGPFRKAVQRRRAHRMDSWLELGLAWLSPELHEVLLARRLAQIDTPPLVGASLAQRGLLRSLDDGFNTYANEFHARIAAQAGYEPRSPFFARKMIEFQLRIPANLRLRGNENRYLHRSALRGRLLPDAVADRRTKAYYETPYLHLLDDLRERVANSKPASAKGWLRSEGVRRLIAPDLAKAPGEQPIYELWGLLGVQVLDNSVC